MRQDADIDLDLGQTSKEEIEEALNQSLPSGFTAEHSGEDIVIFNSNAGGPNRDLKMATLYPSQAATLTLILKRKDNEFLEEKTEMMEKRNDEIEQMTEDLKELKKKL